MFPPGTNFSPVSEVVVVVWIKVVSTWSVDTIKFWNVGRIGAGIVPAPEASMNSNVVGP